MFNSLDGRTGILAVFCLFWSYLKRHRLLLTTHLVGIFLIQIATLATPWFLRQLINILATARPSPETLEQLFSLIGYIGGAWFFGWLAFRLDYLSAMYFQTRIMADLMGDSFNYILRHSYNFFVSHFAGSITHRISRLGRSFEIFVDTLLLEFFATLLFIAGEITVLSLQHPVLGIVLTL